MLTHHISTISVFQSYEYNNFSIIKGNRPLNEGKIKKIIKEIEAGNDMLEYYPILVKMDNDKLLILDGQHRYFISKKLKRPVLYILAKEKKSMAEIAKVNSNVEKWKPENFINCYIHEGSDDYKQLQAFITEFGFSVGICLNLLSTGQPGPASGQIGLLHDEFKDGTFKIKKWKEANEFASEVKKFSEFGNWRGRPFVIAINRVITADKVSVDDLVAAWQKNKAALTEQATFKDYLLLLEQIMNIGKKIRVIIH